MVCWPSRGAVQGVAGARMTSTLSNSLATSSRYQRRNFCAFTTSEAGIMAPAISRSRTAGSKSLGRAAQAVEVQRGALGGGDHIGSGARACGFGELDLARRAERLGDAFDGVQRLGRCTALEIATGDRDAQTRGAALQCGQRRLDRPLAADRVVGIVALHGVVGERQVAGRARQRPQVIEARHEREGARARQPAVGRLEAEQAAERGRHADRAVGVGAERDRHQPAGHRAARAAGGAAGHARPCRADCARGRRARSRR